MASPEATMCPLKGQLKVYMESRGFEPMTSPKQAPCLIAIPQPYVLTCKARNCYLNVKCIDV